jgi:hypothetical protein
VDHVQGKGGLAFPGRADDGGVLALLEVLDEIRP